MTPRPGRRCSHSWDPSPRTELRPAPAQALAEGASLALGAVVVILTLSVLGGSMFPSFLMPAGLQAIGRLTFNAWALEAYRKVFWYERPVHELAPEIESLYRILSPAR